MTRPHWLEGAPRHGSDRLVLAGLAMALAVCPVAFWPALYDDFTLLKQASLLVGAALVLLGFVFGAELFPRSRALRVAVAAWVAALVVSAALGSDPLGGLLGVYQYRQGLLTQLAYVVLFLGALHAARADFARLALTMPAAGLAGAFAYTAIQATGNDPNTWWTDTSARAIGTIGNANELAAYTVITLAIVAVVAPRRGRGAAVGIGAVAAAVTFIVLESESRSGIIGLGCFAAALPIAWALGKRPFRALGRPAAALGAGLAGGIVLSLLAGSLAGAADRVTTSDRGGATRMSLWKGTLEAIEASPVIGHGPDGLWLPFMEHRPQGLRGTFEVYDLTAQSSHNLVLDTLANTGVLGLAALLAAVAVPLWRSVRARRSEPAEGPVAVEFAWAAIAAYGAMTFLNPVSLAPHAMFFVLLGLLAGLAEGPRRKAVPSRRETPRAVAFAFALLAGALALAGIALPIADLRAERAWNTYARGDFEAAAGHYADATRALPFDRNYAAREADARLAAAVGAPENATAAVEAYADLDDWFGLASEDAFGAAASLFAAGAPAEEVEAMVARAVRLNPEGLETEERASQLRAAIAGGGTLQYSWGQRRTFVLPDEP